LFIQETIDIIIHTATFYGKNKESVSDMAHANLFSAFELLNKAIENNCGLFINTDTVLERFVNLYALTKSQFRDWLFMRSSEIKVVNMKLEHFYGEGASNTNFITSMIRLLSENKESIDLTKGEQRRNFIYIDDVISAYKTILNNGAHLIDNYTDIEVCTNETISIRELLSLMKETLNSSTLLNWGALNYRNKELMESNSDNSELLKLGWSPRYSINEGIKKTIDKKGL